MKASEYMTSNVFIIVIIVIFIIYTLYYIYSVMNAVKKNRNKKAKANLTSGVCPNYWESVKVTKDIEGNLIHTCRNKHFLGSCSLTPGQNEFTFSDDIFTNSQTSDMAKCKFAKQCDLTWTGYDNLCSK